MSERGSLEWYKEFWDTCEIKNTIEAKSLVEWAYKKAIAGQERYKLVSEKTNVPWQMIAAIHCLEASFNFNCHLHNGDPLNDYTKRVPAGRPKIHAPPFTWEESAIDALTYDGLTDGVTLSVPLMLMKCEKFNGTGYLKYHPETLSPYLWSCTNHYIKGKYVADGKYDPDAVSKQVGVAALFKALGVSDEKPIDKLEVLERRIRDLEIRVQILEETAIV